MNKKQKAEQFFARCRAKQNGWAIGGGALMVSGAAHADVAAMQTAAETAITTAEGAVGAILVAGLVITVALWSYAKIKAAIRRN